MTFWGEHTTILGWYETLENIEKEIQRLKNTIVKPTQDVNELLIN